MIMLTLKAIVVQRRRAALTAVVGLELEMVGLGLEIRRAIVGLR